MSTASGTTLSGIDISAWQTTTPSLTGVSFVFARATYGAAFDERYDMHAANVARAGLVLGAYHFGVSQSEYGWTPQEQAEAFLASVGDTTALLVLDQEAESGLVPMSDAEARQFIAAIKAKGRRCGLYHSDSGYPSLGQDFDWVANWGASPSHPWDIWQYTGSPLDRDTFAGTLADLRALAGGDMDWARLAVVGKANVKAGGSLYRDDPDHPTDHIDKWEWSGPTDFVCVTKRSDGKEMVGLITTAFTERAVCFYGKDLAPIATTSADAVTAAVNIALRPYLSFASTVAGAVAALNRGAGG